MRQSNDFILMITCGGLNDSGSYRLVRFNARSSAGENVWEGLESMGLIGGDVFLGVGSEVPKGLCALSSLLLVDHHMSS